MDYSFVVPTRDRNQILHGCIASLTSVRAAGRDWEVVIVDDGSITPVSIPDSTGAPWNGMRVLRETGRGPAAARNSGARVAEGRILVFIDDDCRPYPDILAELERAYASFPDTLIAGRIVHGVPENIWSTITHALTEASYETQERLDRRPRRFSTSFLAVPREGFLRVGGFDEAFGRPGGEDYEFCERWANEGGGSVYAREPFVVHVHPLTFRQFVRQQLNYGRGLMRAHAAGSTRRQQRGFLTKLADLRLTLLHPFTAHSLPRAISIAGGMLLAQAFTAAGAVRILFSRESTAARARPGIR